MLRKLIEENQSPTVLNLKNYNETLKAEAAEFDPRFHTELEEVVHQGDLGRFDAFFSNKLRQKTGKLSEILYSLIKIINTASLPIVERANEIISSSKDLGSIKVDNLNIYLNKLASRHSNKLAASTYHKMMSLPNSPVALLSPGYLFDYLEDCLDNTQHDAAGLLHLESQLIFAMDFLEQLSEIRQRESSVLQSEYLRYLSSNVLSRVVQRLIDHAGISAELKETVDAVLARYHRLFTRQVISGLPEVAYSDVLTAKSFIDYFVYYSAEVDHRTRTVLLDNEKLLFAVETANNVSEKMQALINEQLAAVFKTGASNHPQSVEYRFAACYSELQSQLELLQPKGNKNYLAKLLLAATARFAGQPVRSSKPTGNYTIDSFTFDSLVYGSLTEESQSHKTVASEIKTWASMLAPGRTESSKDSISPHANLELYEEVILPTLSGQYETANREMNQRFIGPIMSDVMCKKILAFYDYMLGEVHAEEYSYIRRMRNMQRVQEALRNVSTWREWCKLYDATVAMNYKDKQAANLALHHNATDLLIFRKMVRQTDLLEFNHRLNRYIYKPKGSHLKSSPESQAQEQAALLEQEQQEAAAQKTATPEAQPDAPEDASAVEKQAEGSPKKSAGKNKKKKSKTNSWEQKIPVQHMSITSLLQTRMSYKLFTDYARGDQLTDFYMRHSTPELFRRLPIAQNAEHMQLAVFLLDIGVRTQSPELLVHGERLCGLLQLQLNPLQREQYLAFKALIAAHSGSLE